MANLARMAKNKPSNLRQEWREAMPRLPPAPPENCQSWAVDPDYVGADTGAVIKTVPFYDPGLDREGAPWLSYGFICRPMSGWPSCGCRGADLICGGRSSRSMCQGRWRTGSRR
jgi:hypothetical protein